VSVEAPSIALQTLDALASLSREHPGDSFTTSEVARRAGVEDGRAGRWTAPTRQGLFACMAAGLVATPTRRSPYRWRLTPAGRERTGTTELVRS